MKKKKIDEALREIFQIKVPKVTDIEDVLSDEMNDEEIDRVDKNSEDYKTFVKESKKALETLERDGAIVITPDVALMFGHVPGIMALATTLLSQIKNQYGSDVTNMIIETYKEFEED